MKDIRLCKVWIKYQTGPFHEKKMQLDMDDSIEDQIYKKFGRCRYGKTPDWRLIDFSWREIAEGEQQ